MWPDPGVCAGSLSAKLRKLLQLLKLKRSENLVLKSVVLDGTGGRGWHVDCSGIEEES